ncbi:LCP family protein [Clostridium septicum]|uniref:LCP family glycopolymer transferase n=1 Tax=Clostridium septicum TaxID=1504 RepID=UPI0032166ABC
MSENNTSSEMKNTNKKKTSKKKKSLIILLSIIAVIAILSATVVGYYYKLRNQVYTKYTPEPTAGTDYKEVDGVTNVLLIGTDGRTLDEAARSDTIMIATLDNNNKVIKLTSIMRDTLVNIPGYGEGKINAAFAVGAVEGGAQGGAKLLIETIRETFKIDLKKYIIVNFWGFESIIDEIGGIEADIKDYEIEELNNYIGETTETESALIEKTGVQKLNGAQALSYSRIRKVGNGSYERTERQRKVLTQIATKLKDVSPLRYVSIANSIAKHVNTNIDIPEALDLAYTIYKLPDLKIEQLQMPQTELIVRDGEFKNLGWVLLIDKEQNSKVLHDFIFENKLPDSKEYDYYAIESLKSTYDAEHERYTSLYGTVSEENNDKNLDDDLPLIREPKPETNTNTNTNTDSGNNTDKNPPVTEQEKPSEKPPTTEGNKPQITPPTTEGNKPQITPPTTEENPSVSENEKPSSSGVENSRNAVTKVNR